MRRLKVRDRKISQQIEKAVPVLLKGATPKIEVAVTQLIRDLKLKPGNEIFVKWVRSNEQPSEVRIAALRALFESDERSDFVKALEIALGAADAKLRFEAISLLSQQDADRTVEILKSEWSGFKQREKQRAISILGSCRASSSFELLTKFAQQELNAQWPVELSLDLREALKASRDESLLALRKKIDEQSNSKSHLLSGGDARRGELVFRNHVSAQCVRCHDAGGKGKQAGPVLKGIGKRADRQYLLESLLEPSKKIADGFGALQLLTESGRVYTGTLIAETDTHLSIMDIQGKRHNIPLDEIEARKPTSVSSMPEMAEVLRPAELRDLVEYLKTSI